MRQKILCLVIPSLQAGGMERVMSELSWHFSSKQDIQLHLVLYGISREIFYKIPDNITIHKPTFIFKNKWRFYFTLKTIFFLRKTIKKIQPISVLSFGEYWNNFVLLSTLGVKSPVFVSDRSQPDKSLGKFHDKLRKWLYPKAKGLILQTEKAKEIYLQNNPHGNIAVIGNPVRSIMKERNSDIRENSVLMVGRLIESKHQDQLIQIFAKVNPPNWKLQLVGYDHLKQSHMERLRKLAKELKVEERIEFLGKQDELDEIYLKSSIFAFTSSSEGFPNVIGEAMSAGLPVVAYDCVAGPSEMINDGKNGFLVPLFDSSTFELKLAELINDEKLRKRFGKNASESIKEFSSEKICESFYQFIVQ